MINLDQIRAQRAFEKATDVSSPNSKIVTKEYLGLARSLPAMFQNNGLLATWAFLLSKKRITTLSMRSWKRCWNISAIPSLAWEPARQMWLRCLPMIGPVSSR